MAWETPGAELNAQGSVNEVLAQESAGAFMAKVYRWMVAGLAVTAVTAVYTASNEAVLQVVVPNLMPIIIGKFILVMVMSWLAPRLSAPLAGGLFLLYSFTTGLVFSVLFLVYQLGSIGQAFAVTGGAFAALSAYGTFTKKDLSAWRTFLFMGLIGVVIAGVVQIFVQSSMLEFVWSCACVVVFAGLTAYDTQKLRTLHASSGYSSAGTFAVSGALTLYLDFVNLFLAILRLMGRRR
ncbi:MAG: Bax inhibitor-1/YccA family protein [Myxococcota bacterium]